MKKNIETFPFTAIVGQERMKKSLILNAINSNLGGVLIRGEKGTAKSTAVRALANLLPQIEVVEDCLYCCNPYQRNEMCPECLKLVGAGQELSIVKKSMRVVDLPLGATEDRVIGSLDIEHAIKKGEKSFEPGILASVNRGILYVDEVNLLDDHLVDVLLDAAAMGINYIEREGVSFSHPARFILIGTMNPEEGDLRPQLLDRFGLCVDVEGINNPNDRVEVIRRYIKYEADPISFKTEWEEEEKKLSKLLLHAKELLPRVKYDNDIFDLIVNISIDMSVDGHRADIYMLKVAQTIAAFHQRTYISPNDVEEAAELVITHRMRKKPFQEPTVDKEKLKESIDKHKKKGDSDLRDHTSEKREENPEDNDHNKNKKKDNNHSEETFDIGLEYKIKKIASTSDKKIKTGSGRRSRARSDKKSGRYRSSTIPKGRVKDIALDATLRAAAPFQLYREKEGKAISIKTEDIREKVREKKIGNTIIFVVDSSGSMGAQRRMIEVKGAILSLLVDAYKKRDRVGLVAFKGDKAELLLKPTSSVELAKKYLEVLPTGGKTPLSKGLSKGLEVIENELNRNSKIKPFLVIISDGKANVSIDDNTDPFNEAKFIAENIKNAGIQSILIDTEKSYIRLGKLQELSESMSGKYCMLEDIKSEAISNLVRNTFT